MKIIPQVKFKDCLSNIVNNCTNPEKVTAAKRHNKSLATDQDKLRKLNKDKIKKSLKKVEARQES